MKSLFLTGMLTMGVAHTGAFLDVWDVPHVENHITIKDLGRKLNKVFKWEEQRDSLRNAREKAREENYALYDNAPQGPQGPLAKPRSRRAPGPFKPMRSRSSSRK